MSIRYIVGNPGSGKTYLAVAKLYEYFIDEKRKKEPDWLFAYTNINEFDFTKSEIIKPLDLDVLYDGLTDLHNLYLDKVTDDELNEKAKELNLYNVLFVIDECHSNIFHEKNDKVIIWWLTYHRHMYQDIWLITQNLSLVDTKYKKIAEFFYKAIDGSNRLFGNRFKYALFNSPTMYNKRDIVPGGGISLKFNPEIYSLYHSGDKTIHKSYIKYYFLISFLFIALFIFLFFLFKKSFMSDEKEVIKQDLSKQNLVISKDLNSTNSPLKLPFGISQLYPYNVKCFDKKCFIFEANSYIPESLLKMIISDSSLYFYDYKELISGEFIYFFIFTSDVFLNFKEKRLDDDEKSSIFSIGGIK